MARAGAIAIALSVICLIASFALALPGWINLAGIGFGLVGLIFLGLARRGGGGAP